MGWRRSFSCWAMFAALMEELHGQTAANADRISKDLRDAIAANTILLECSPHEPIQRHMSTETLALLQQFGRDLADALKALEAVGEGKRRGGYAAQLEPRWASSPEISEKDFSMWPAAFIAGALMKRAGMGIGRRHRSARRKDGRSPAFRT